MNAEGSPDEARPDLRSGVVESDVPADGMLLGRVGERAVLLVRVGDDIVAVQADCPHYGGPLAEGCLDGDTLHCPWHHAAFDVRDGSVVRPPALAPLQRWAVERAGGRVRVIGADPSPPAGPPTPPRRRIAPVVVVGAGAAGTAAVLALRSHGHEGSLTLVDPEPDAPYDRPNLSKDYLEGTAPEEWLPLRGPDDWKALGVRRIVDRVAELDIGDRRVRLQGHGEDLEWDALVLATGARPRRLGVPGSSLPHVLVLRSLEDCRKLRDRAARAARVVVVGTGFLGLEAAASLRRRDLAVAVVGPEREPLEHVFGREVGAEVRAVHEREGVVFRLERTVTRIDPGRVALSDGTSLPADLVLVSVGVQPDVRLAEAAGLALGEGGVAVDRHLATSAPGVWAVGDIASFPHPEGGRHIRIEHWAVAEAQGRIASRNVLGIATPFDQIPFFWTKHFDTTIAWSGFPDPWDRILREGSLVGGDAAYRFVGDGRDVGLATVGRDRESLQWEIERSAVIERASRR